VIAGWHRRRLQMRPGMTGVWQVMGSARVPMSEMVELDNLYVLDSSFFVSIGAVNPTLTIIANTLRVGEHLLERLG